MGMPGRSLTGRLERTRNGLGDTGLACVLLTVALVVLGTVLHLWYLFHLPLNSDQAVAGLMAQRMVHGHFTAFYYGQVYGGSAEELVIAVFGSLFGYSALSINGAVMFLFAVSSVLTWRVARRLVADRGVALLAGALVWTAPLALVSNGTYAYGFRGATIVCGVAGVLVALRMLDSGPSVVGSVTWGTVAGIGWWSSPEMVFFLVPAVVVLITVAWRARRAGWRMLAAVPAFALAALPWIWANTGSHLASLDTGSLSQVPGTPDWAGRFHIYFQYALPMLMGLRAQYSGAWLGGHPTGPFLYVVGAVIVLASLAVAALRGGGPRAVAAGVVLFPFLLAVSPTSRNWGTGRYAMYDCVLLVLVVAVGVDRLAGKGEPRRLEVAHAGRGLFALIAVALAAATVSTFVGMGQLQGTRWWSSPDDPTQASMNALVRSGVRDGYADYWVAYRLNLLSGERLRLTPVAGDTVRDPVLARSVAADPNAAWVFVPPTALSLAQFGLTTRIAGPDGISETKFTAALRRMGVPYREIDAGLIHAVIPGRPVSPGEVSG
jgi:hypothetical protein